jgi:hypothetical protein
MWTTEFVPRKAGSGMEDRCKDRSSSATGSSDDGIDQRFFDQLAWDKRFKEEPRRSRRRETVQTKVCHSFLDGLAPEKAFRDSYCSGCCHSKRQYTSRQGRPTWLRTSNSSPSGFPALRDTIRTGFSPAPAEGPMRCG